MPSVVLPHSAVLSQLHRYVSAIHRYCKCTRETGTRFAILLPPLLLFALLGWTLYAHWVVLLYRITFIADHVAETLVMGSLFHLLWILDVLCLCVVMMNGPGLVTRGRRRRAPRGPIRRALEESELFRGDGYDEHEEADDEDYELGNAFSGDTPLLLEGTFKIRGKDNFRRQSVESNSSAKVIFDDSFEDDHPVSSSHTDTHLKSSLMLKSSGKQRYCRKCQVDKPDRAHHCRVCKTCVLKMDHHCPFLGTCVGLHNYKMFVQWLCYSCALSISCAVITGISLSEEVTSNNGVFVEAPITCIALLIISGVVSIIFPGFTVYHLYLVGNNRTTIENIESSAPRIKVKQQDDQDLEANPFHSHSSEHSTLPDSEGTRRPPKLRRYSDLSRRDHVHLSRYNIYDLGVARNFCQVFGTSFLEWFLPVRTRGCDGYVWPVEQDTLDTLAELTRKLREREQKPSYPTSPVSS